MNLLREHRVKILISLVVAGCFVWLLNRGALPIWPAPKPLARFDWSTLCAYLGLWTVVHIIRAVRWQLLLAPLAPVPLKKTVGVAFVGFAAVILLPLRTGEVVRPALIRQKENLSGWSATGTVAAERIIDGLMLSVLLWFGILAAVPMEPLPDQIGDLPISPKLLPAATYSALLLFTAAFTAMALFYFAREWAYRQTRATLGRIAPKLADWLAERVDRLAQGLKFLESPRVAAPFIALTAVYWLLNAASTLLLAEGCGLAEMTYPQACVVMGVLALGVMVPNAPGFFGAFQLAIYAALALYFPQDQLLGDGSVLVFMMYAAQLGITLSGAVVGAYLARGTSQSSNRAKDQWCARPEP